MSKSLDLLVIDDSEDDRELYRRLLKSDEMYEWSVSEAEDGDQGLDYIRNSRPDCILLDYSLPGADGLKVLAQLREEDAFVPIVMLTGQGNEAVAVDAMRIGAQDYITKGAINKASIQRAIHNAIEHNALQEKIASQQEELENFANVLAHDLKEPARSIAHLVAFLRHDIEDRLEDRSTEYFSLISDASDRMMSLIETVSSYTFIDKQKPRFDTVNMKSIVESAISDLDVTVRETHAIVTFDDMPTVQGNEPQLRQLMQNLIGNALKYCERDIPMVHVGATLEDEAWVISVQDNGIGMKKEYLGKIFEAFKRLHPNEQYEGTGLGLAICRKIVHRHNGDIWVESDHGEGSTFFFSLPVAEEGGFLQVG